MGFHDWFFYFQTRVETWEDWPNGQRPSWSADRGFFSCWSECFMADM